jgi:hypothetical protein
MSTKAKPKVDEHAYLREANNIVPDWKKLYTPAAAEADLKGFKFLGPGWYNSPTETVLVIPSAVEEQFYFWVYDGRNPAEGFNQIINAPVRVDTRDNA